MTADLERLWEDLLSEDAGLILAALLSLPREDREGALAHLRGMANEAGWSEGQSRRARAALAVAAGDPRLRDPEPHD